MLQITASGFQTGIRETKKSDVAERHSNETFRVGRYTLAPGFLRKNGTGKPDVLLFENCAALVKVTMGSEVDVCVEYLTGKYPKINKPTDRHVYKYTSAPA